MSPKRPSLSFASRGGSSAGSTPNPLPNGVTLCTDVSPAGWIEERLARHSDTVGQVMPDCFEAYARVLHPASALDDTPVRWATIATRTGRMPHALMQFERIAGLADDPNARPTWGQRPLEGVAPVDELFSVLRVATDSKSCYFGLWDGFGGLDMIDEVVSAPRFRIPNLSYVLFRGPIEAVKAFGPSRPPWMTPNLWWPEDRAWCVASDIDLASTYVGARAECIAALLREPGLEAFPARIDDLIGLGADKINPENR